MSDRESQQKPGFVVAFKIFLFTFMACFAAVLHAQEFSEDSYEVFFGDFNGDGKSGDVYFHKKDKLILIFGEITIPIPIADDGSYVVYEGGTSATPLKLSASSLAEYVRGVLGEDYYFTDVDGDSDVDIISVAHSSSGKSIALLYESSGAPVVQVNELSPENIEAAPLPSLASPSGIVSGAEIANTDKLTPIMGKFRVDESGAATYNIALDVPEGTAGVAPQLSLNYSSQASVGVAGLGWSLGGIEGVQRCRQTLVQDGEAKPLTWSENDRFCLNGSRLLVVSGNYGAPGSKYKTEIDSGVLVTAVGGTTGLPDYFEMTAKDGSITTFGGSGSANSELNAYLDSIEQPTKTLSWKISRFEDSVGNYINYVYLKSSAGHNIDRILYAYGDGGVANAEIEFVYQDRERSDSMRSYVAGYEFNSTRLLAQVVTKNNGDGFGLKELYRYVLNYHAESDYENDKLSRLQSIQLCGSGVCYDEVKTEFIWGDSEIGYTNTKNYRYLGHDLSGSDIFDMVIADVNGDGQSDLVWVEERESGGAFEYRLYSSTHKNDEKFVAVSYASSKLERGLKVFDYNADARSDVYFNKKLYVASPIPGGDWKLEEVASPNFDNSGDPLLLDINSDGLEDEIVISSNGDISYRLLERDVSQPASSALAYHFGETRNTSIDLPSSYFINADNIAVGDYNGDGQLDFALNIRVVTAKMENVQQPTAGEYYANRYSYRDSIGIFVKNWSGYELFDEIPVNSYNYRWTANTSQNVLFFMDSFSIKPSVDINGDGLSDVIFSTNTNRTWKYALSTGTEFRSKVEIDLFLVEDDYYVAPEWVDYNYDGYLDIYWHSHAATRTTSPKYMLWDSATNGYLAWQTASSYMGLDASRLFDFDGDGRLDHVQFDVNENRIAIQRGEGYGTYVTAGHGDKIYKIKHTQGNETEIRYTPLNFHWGITDTSPTRKSHYSSLEGLSYSGALDSECVEYAIPVDGGGTIPVCHAVVSKSEKADFYKGINAPFSELPEDSIKFIPENGAPVFNVAGSGLVVSQVLSSAPHESNPNARNSVSYYYHMLRIQAGGRGALG